jgi:hypothetical protein
MKWMLEDATVTNKELPALKKARYRFPERMSGCRMSMKAQAGTAEHPPVERRNDGVV